MKVKCGNCNWKGDSSELTEDGIKDLEERLYSGSVVPCLDGECPKCRGLTYHAPEGDEMAIFERLAVERLRRRGFAVVVLSPSDKQDGSGIRRLLEQLEA